MIKGGIMEENGRNIGEKEAAFLDEAKEAINTVMIKHAASRREVVIMLGTLFISLAHVTGLKKSALKRVFDALHEEYPEDSARNQDNPDGK